MIFWVCLVPLHTMEGREEKGQRRKSPTLVILMVVSSFLSNLLVAVKTCMVHACSNAHPFQSAAKMRSGVPLTDSDRAPWLLLLSSVLHSYMTRGQGVVLACSALKPAYREVLRNAPPPPHVPTQKTLKSEWLCNSACATIDNGATLAQSSRGDMHVYFIHLAASLDVFHKRVVEREGVGQHYMPAALLKSQMDALQLLDGEEGIVSVNAAKSPTEIVDDIRTILTDFTTGR